MSTLPNWVYDLIIALERYEDEGHHLRPDWDVEDDAAACAGKWLGMIPSHVRDEAAAIAAYQREAAQDKRPAPVTADRCAARFGAQGRKFQCAKADGHDGYHIGSGYCWNDGEQA